MSKKGFIYLLIIGISVVNFIFSMEETSDGRMQNIAEERIAQSLGIGVLELKELLSDSQGQNITSIVRKKYDNDWTLLMHMAKGKFLCKEYARGLYPKCEDKFYSEIYLKIAELFIKYGADINVQNNNDRTALMIAYSGKNEPIIKLLLESHNIAMNVQDKNGFTPLHYAIKLGYDVIACKLIDRGAPLNTKTKFISYRRTERGYSWKIYSDDETPLMLAARRNSLPVVECLLGEDADPLLRSTVGQKAYDIATDDAVKEVIKRAELRVELQKKAIETAGKKALQVKIEAKKYLEDQQKLREKKALQVAKESARQQEERKRRQELEQERLQIIADEVKTLEIEMFRKGEKDKLRLQELRVAKESARQQEEREKKRQKDTKEKELVPKMQDFGEKLKSGFYKFMSYFQ